MILINDLIKIYRFIYSRYDDLFDVFYVLAENDEEAKKILLEKHHNLKFGTLVKSESIEIPTNISKVIDSVYGVIGK